MTDQGLPGLRIESDGQCVTWTLDAPARRNAVTPAVLNAIESQCAQLRQAIVVLRGGGDEAFCAGFDLTALANAAPPTAQTPDDALPDAALLAATAAMRQADATFVAAVGGYSIGAGVELMCACDIRIAAEHAWFQVPAAKLGVVYHADGLARMQRVFGDAAVARLLLLGRRISAADAAAAGALIDVVPRAEFDDAVEQIVTELTRAAPLSLAGNRTLLRRLTEGPLSDGARHEHAAARRAAYASDDHKEARTAVAQRRPPRFTGR